MANAAGPPAEKVADKAEIGIATNTLPLPHGQLTGWASIDKAVRDHDEQRVKDCKEDIDTLLTFVSTIAMYMIVSS